MMSGREKRQTVENSLLLYARPANRGAGMEGSLAVSIPIGAEPGHVASTCSGVNTATGVDTLPVNSVPQNSLWEHHNIYIQICFANH